MAGQLTPPVERIWDELRVEKDLAINFIAVFARFEYALKRTGFLRSGTAAQPDWNCFGRSLSREVHSRDLEPVFTVGSYLVKKPTKRQIVRGDALFWEEYTRPEGLLSLSWLLEVVGRTRNNLFHGGKFQHGEEGEPLRDTQLIQSSMDVLLSCLSLDCDSAKRVHEVFWRFDAP